MEGKGSIYNTNPNLGMQLLTGNKTCMYKINHETQKANLLHIFHEYIMAIH